MQNKMWNAWFRECARWFAQFKYGCYFLSICGLSWLFLCAMHWQENDIKWTGLFLQILGLGVVLCGVRETRKEFGHSTGVQRLIKPVKEFPRPRKVIEGAGASLQATGLNSGFGTATISSAPTTLEERFSALEEEFRTHRTNVANRLGDLDLASREQAARILAEETARTEQIRKVSYRLERISTGGLNLSVIGVLWVLIGSVLSTMPGEIATWMVGAPMQLCLSVR
jgi:hypothetical protein